MTPEEPRHCFVIIPYGKKMDGAGNEIDFDAVYRNVIRGAVEEAGFTPVRCDERALFDPTK